MKPKVFLAFVLPSVMMMLVFIALPLGAVFIQSFHLDQRVFEERTVENCTPGFPSPVCTTSVRLEPVRKADGTPIVERVFVGLENYRTVLDLDGVARAFGPDGSGWRALMNIDFYKALRFTLMFTFVTLPLVVGLGLVLALAVNRVAQNVRGPVIFVTLLPFIITPVIGALSIRWLFIGDGILTRAIEYVLERDVAMFAQAWTIEVLMLFYKVWHVAPFAFVVFYAGLQTVNQDSIDASVVDGASRWETLRFVVVPHLMPLIVFVSLIHLMDSYRVFEEVIGFSSQAHVISLQWLTYHYLLPEGTAERAISRASANSMLTMIGIVILLVPLLRKTWRDHRRTWSGR
jgi:multiple sugar transport system permease protein